jgi:hypothetical protein
MSEFATNFGDFHLVPIQGMRVFRMIRTLEVFLFMFPSKLSVALFLFCQICRLWGQSSPTNIDLSSLVIPLNAVSGTLLADLSTIDRNNQDLHAYTLVSGVGVTTTGASVSVRIIFSPIRVLRERSGVPMRSACG